MASPLPVSRGSVPRPTIAAAVLVTGAVALALCQWYWMPGRRDFDHGWPWAIAGLLAVALGRILTPEHRRPTGRWTRGEWAFVLAIVVLGAALRLVALEDAPPGAFFDEAENGMVARRILAGERPVFVSGTTQMPAFYFYLLAGSMSAFGDDLHGVRVLSALLGTLTLPIFYLVARRFVSRPAAMAATLMLAGSRWHLTFSRVGFTGIMGPLVELLAVFFLLRALTTRRFLHFAGLGVAIGIGLQTYYSFNLFPIVAAVGVISRTLARRKGDPLRPGRAFAGVLLCLLVAGVILAPLIRYAIREPARFFERPATVVIWNPAHHLPVLETLRQNVKLHAFMFNFSGDSNPRHNIPDEPLLGAITGVLFLAGLGTLLVRGWRFPGVFWLAWLVVMLMPGILTIESPQAYRTVGAIPAVYLIIAQGLEIASVTASRLTENRLWRRGASVCLVLVAVAAVGQDAGAYFLRQVNDPRAWEAFDGDHRAVAQFVAENAARWDVWVSPFYTENPSLPFFLTAEQYQRFIASDHFPIDPARLTRRGDGLVYVLEPFQADLFPLLRSQYPSAELTTYQTPFGAPSFVAIRVPKDDVDRALQQPAGDHGLTAAYYPNLGWEGEPPVVKREPAVLFHYHWSADPLPDPFAVDWTAWLTVETAGEHSFDLTATGPCLLRIDDQTIIEGAGFPPDLPPPVTATIHLDTGRHRLLVRYVENSFTSAIRLHWTPPGGEREVIPLRLLQPFSLDEYLRLRPGLPRPHATP